MKKLTQKNALNKLLNILRKHGLIFKSTNEKIINHLLEYEHLKLKLKTMKTSEAFLYFQIEHPEYNNLDYIYDYTTAPGTALYQKIRNALNHWESKTENTVLTH
jgi:hypothetical protein